MAVVLDSDTVVAFLDRTDALHDAADEAIRDLLGKDRPDALILATAELHAEVDLVVTGDQRATKTAGSSFKVKLLQQR